MVLAQLDLDGGSIDPRHRPSRPATANLQARPWPLEDLLRGMGISAALLAEVLGLDETALYRRLTWGLDDIEADHWAIALGTHPGNIWPEWFDVVDLGNEQLDLFAEPARGPDARDGGT